MGAIVRPARIPLDDAELVALLIGETVDRAGDIGEVSLVVATETVDLQGDDEPSAIKERLHEPSATGGVPTSKLWA